MTATTRHETPLLPPKDRSDTNRLFSWAVVLAPTSMNDSEDRRDEAPTLSRVLDIVGKSREVAASASLDPSPQTLRYAQGDRDGTGMRQDRDKTGHRYSIASRLPARLASC